MNTDATISLTSEEVDAKNGLILGHPRSELYERALAGDTEAEAILINALNRAIEDHPADFETDPVVARMGELSLPRQEW